MLEWYLAPNKHISFGQILLIILIPVCVFGTPSVIQSLDSSHPPFLLLSWKPPPSPALTDLTIWIIFWLQDWT